MIDWARTIQELRHEAPQTSLARMKTERRQESSSITLVHKNTPHFKQLFP